MAGKSETILADSRKHFVPIRESFSWGKWMFLGKPGGSAASDIVQHWVCEVKIDAYVPAEVSGPAETFIVSVVIPCLNEANSVGICIDKALAAFDAAALIGEVVVADNGSTDGSQEIAQSHGARVVRVEQRGYGAALHAGINASRGRFIVMGDADDSYDFSEVPRFVRKLLEGYDLVMGNRFRGGIKQGAMPRLHKYFGNPGLTALLNLFFHMASATFIVACVDSPAKFTTA